MNKVDQAISMGYTPGVKIRSGNTTGIILGKPFFNENMLNKKDVWIEIDATYIGIPCLKVPIWDSNTDTWSQIL